jgi:SulP family sulfate permease
VTSLKSLLPILGWAPAHTKTEAQSDLVAAVIVTIMLVPQSLACAMLAGLPPQVGLYASVLPLIAYAVFGTSRALAAVVSLMTAVAVGQVAATGSAAYLTAAITLALMSGLILVAMSVLRLGVMANFLSHPVISGIITHPGGRKPLFRECPRAGGCDP